MLISSLTSSRCNIVFSPTKNIVYNVLLTFLNDICLEILHWSSNRFTYVFLRWSSPATNQFVIGLDCVFHAKIVCFCCFSYYIFLSMNMSPYYSVFYCLLPLYYLILLQKILFTIWKWHFLMIYAINIALVIKVRYVRVFEMTKPRNKSICHQLGFCVP